MAEHLFPDFLDNREQYAKATDWWVQLWEGIDPPLRAQNGWIQPWMLGDWQRHAVFRDGNPIFSAYSSQKQRGIRVIQHAPTTDAVEFDAYFDTFGGAPSDPDAIFELVISCALSEEVRDMARARMRVWISDSVEEVSRRFLGLASSESPFYRCPRAR